MNPPQAEADPPDAGWVAVALLGKSRGNRGEITALALSMILLKEGGSPSKFAGVALVVAGIVLLRTGRA